MQVQDFPYGDALRRHAERKPEDAFALIYPDRSLTWREFDGAANRHARWYKSLGVGEGDFVVLALPNSVEFHVATFAIWKLGAVPTVVSAGLAAGEFSAIVEMTRPRILIGGPPDTAFGVPRIGQDWAAAEDFSAEPYTSAVASYWKALTSGGSTGRPKVIVDHTPSFFSGDLSSLLSLMKISVDGVILNAGPLYHGSPFVYSHLSLIAGCTVVGMMRFDPEEFLRLVEKYRVTFAAVVPTMMNRIWSLPEQVRAKYDISSLKTVVHTASFCPVWLKQAWIEWLGGDRIWEFYGGSEGIGGTSISGSEWLEKPGSVGRSVNTIEISALREDGSKCAPGEIGELCFFDPAPGPHRYHYIGAAPRKPAPGWQTFGDLGYVDEDGYVYLADRRTDLIVRGGANIYPAEVEAALDEYPGIASSIVVGLPCPDMGHRVHAIIEPGETGAFDFDSLTAFLVDRLSKYKLPESYEVSPKPLRDDAGKARRTALREQRIAWDKEGRVFREWRLPGA